jgi:hypothetical protein
MTYVFLRGFEQKSYDIRLNTADDAYELLVSEDGRQFGASFQNLRDLLAREYQLRQDWEAAGWREASGTRIPKVAGRVPERREVRADGVRAHDARDGHGPGLSRGCSTDRSLVPVIADTGTACGITGRAPGDAQPAEIARTSGRCLVDPVSNIVSANRARGAGSS